MSRLPFMQYPFPRVPEQGLKPLNPAPPTYVGSRVGTLGPSLHMPGVSVAAETVSVESSSPKSEVSEKERLIDYCASAGIPIDKRWGIEKLNAAIESHGSK